MANLGSLVVSLEANVAKFSSDMGKAAHIAETSMERVNKAAEMAKRGLELLGIAAGAQELWEKFDGAVEAADQLQKLSEKTGMTVESLSGLQYAAKLSGVDIDGLSIGLKKLSVSMFDAASGGVQQQAIFKSLGIAYKDTGGKLRDTNAVLLDVAERFSKMSNGAEKSALAVKLFGKSGVDLIPLLNEGKAGIKELTDEAERMGIVLSSDTAKRAEEFNDNMERLKMGMQSVTISAMTGLLPALNDIAQAFIDLNNQKSDSAIFWTGIGNGMKGVVIAADSVVTALSEIGHGLVAVQAASAYALTGRFAKAKDAIKEFTDYFSKAEKDYDERTKKLIIGSPAQSKRPPGSEGGTAPIIDTTAANSAKNILDGILKRYEALAQQEQAILTQRNSMLDKYNSDNLISFAAYYQGRANVRAEALKNELADYDKEIAALQAYRARADKATDKADATTKINALLDKKRKLEQDAANQTLTDTMAESSAYEGLDKQIRGVNASLFEMAGHLREAALIRFDDQNESIRKRLAVEGNTAALKQLDTLRAYTAAQADANDLQQQSSLIQQHLAAQEERINISQKTGALGELDALQKVGAARQEAVAQLQKIADKQQAIAEASGNPKLLQDAENFRVSIEKLGAESDLVAQKIQTVFTDAASNAFADFITGSKSAKEAFNDFATAVVNDISKMVAQNLATDLFSGMMGGGSGGSAGSGQNWVGAIASLFGFANGGIMTGAGPMPLHKYATGGVATGPQLAMFGEGSMNEAYVPLPDGRRIPVAMQGAQQSSAPPVVINMNVSTPDANSFKESSGQITSQLTRAMLRGRRNL